MSNASIQSEISLYILNTGQAAIMALGLGAVMALTAWGIAHGQFSIGLFVAGNAILIQLYQPLNLLGTVYREITQGPGGHGGHVPPAEPASGSAGQAGRQTAACVGRRDPLRRCGVLL